MSEYLPEAAEEIQRRSKVLSSDVVVRARHESKVYGLNRYLTNHRGSFHISRFSRPNLLKDAHSQSSDQSLSMSGLFRRASVRVQTRDPQLPYPDEGERANDVRQRPQQTRESVRRGRDETCEYEEIER